MSSTALKIVQGLRESAEAARTADLRVMGDRMIQLERHISRVTYERDALQQIANWWENECLNAQGEINHLKAQIQLIKARHIKECGYFIQGGCHRTHCLCAETCRVD